MFESCVIGGRRFTPARFCAPLAGYTHSAFRRLLAELGGCGLMWTEMLAARQILREDFAASPWLKRRPEEGLVVYQLMVRAGDDLEGLLPRLAEHGVEALDLNLACDAPNIRSREAGSALFENRAALGQVLSETRRRWAGWLAVKIRLGTRSPGWEERLADRLQLLEASGVDAVTVHPRFFEDKFKRRARTELIPWVRSLTRLPIIANGDLSGRAQVEARRSQLEPAAAIMIGRLAVTRPWIFAGWDQPGHGPLVDAGRLWFRMIEFILDDFMPPVALRRVQMFTKYYAANFLFGHRFRVAIRNAATLDEVRSIGRGFFESSPAWVPEPDVAGL